ncbi:ribonuclease III [Hyalangium rubrum]|uniref:Ribonuclease 3 n=1 Tax=Hyalangium rubrum TaxID=3103134 RepID=A0ABU5HCG6_9BACT|nr:ribonuclease III [Hyalangium sp. s54d21]MDY7231153.1 ribonuclease III [Hyalangium sp. s54d21]
MEKPSLQERVQTLEGRLGVAFLRKDLGLAALTHKSYANEHRDSGMQDNERLEFLGDAVVDLAISHRLMERFPNASEGELSKLRALIVNEEGLARIARALNLGELLLLGRGEEMTGGREKSSVLADAMEAVIGALYLGTGMDAVMTLVDRHFSDALEGVAQGRSGLDYKTKLQEDVQNRLKLSPRYRVVSEAGPDHEKTFEVEVSIGSELYARASGRSKKEAEQAAARATLEMLRKDDTPQ